MIELRSTYHAWYLGIGRRYEAGICTIVISMNGAFQHFAVGWILTQNHEKPWIIAFGRVRFLAKI